MSDSRSGDTPRTDAVQFYPKNGEHFAAVPAYFAADLERELAAANRRIDELDAAQVADAAEHAREVETLEK